MDQVAKFEFFEFWKAYNVASSGYINFYSFGAKHFKCMSRSDRFLCIVDEQVCLRVQLAAEDTNCRVLHVRFRIVTNSDDLTCERSVWVCGDFSFFFAVNKGSRVRQIWRRDGFDYQVEKIFDAELFA